jgi:glycosyltransferase involved in cell wall biosynthesis
MTDLPLVSIIIPVFNMANFLPEAIESALTQTYARTEVIVVDDGSTDASREIAASYGRKIRLIRQKNTGLASARNRGIQQAKGSLIGLLDADDRWLSHKLATEVPMFVHQAVGVVHGSYRKFPAGKRAAGTVVKPHGQATSFHRLLRFNEVGAPVSVIFRREAWQEAGGFDPRVPGVEDWDLWIRMSLTQRILGSAPVTSEYRLRDDSMSRNYESMYQSLLAVIGKNSSRHGRCAECQAAARRARWNARSYYYNQSVIRAERARAEGRYLQFVTLRGRATLRDPRALWRAGPALVRRVHAHVWG